MTLNSAAQLTHRLGVGLRAGADLIKLLQSEAARGSGSQRQALQGLIDSVGRGEQLSDAMQREQPFFPTLMIAMTRVGEESGKLERSLLSLSAHYQHQRAVRRALITSIAWPALQLFAAILVVSLLIYLLGMLTPAGGGQMADVLGFGLRGANGVLWFWLYVAIVLGTVAAAVAAFTRNLAGIQNIVPLIYLLPKLGPAIQTITIERFCTTMALSLEAGLDPIRSIQLGLDSTDSEYYRAAADEAEAAIRGGSTLAGALAATHVFPAEFVDRVDIAELSGTDAESMEHLAAEYGERAKTAVKLLAGTATVLVRTAVIVFLVYLIYRIGSTYIGALNDATQPILPR